MSSIPVPTRRGRPSPSGIVRGAPVLAATQWSDMVEGCNWLAGKGACLVPLYCPAGSIDAGSTYTYRFRVRPRASAIAREWGVFLRAADPTVTTQAIIRAPAGSGTTVTVPAPSGVLAGYSIQPVISAASYTEILGAHDATEQEISISIQAVTGDVYVEGLECYEQDRSAVTDNATDFGTLPETVRPGAPIFRLANQSAKGVYDALASADPRRAGIVHYAVDTTDAFQRTTATPQSISALPWKIQVPKLTVGATTGSVKWSAYAKMTSGSGLISLSTTSGVFDSVAVSTTSFAWTTARTIAPACDDFDEVDGYQDDELSIKVTGGGASATLSVATVSVWVDDVT